MSTIFRQPWTRNHPAYFRKRSVPTVPAAAPGAVMTADLPGLIVESAATSTPPVYAAVVQAILPSLTVESSASHTPPVFAADVLVSLPGLAIQSTATSTPPIYAAQALADLPSLLVTGIASHTPPVYGCQMEVNLPSLSIECQALFTPATLPAGQYQIVATGDAFNTHSDATSSLPQVFRRAGGKEVIQIDIPET